MSRRTQHLAWQAKRCVLCAVFAMAVSAMAAQAPQPKIVQPGVSASVAVPTEADKQRAFQADADRLAKLAEQLQVTLQHTRRDELSVKVVQTADEMERLARSARTRIR